MTTWTGRVLTGDRGAELLRSLSEKANEQALKRTCETTGQNFSRFEPWMSNSTKRAEWAELHRNQTLVPDLDHLGKMKALFFQNGPLQAISPSNISQDISLDADTYPSFCKRIISLVAALEDAGGDYKVRVRSLLREVVPLGTASPQHQTRPDGEGLSSQAYRGAVFIKLAEPSSHSTCEDFLNLTHELGHQAFNLVLNADPVVAGDVEQPVYSVIRGTFRPGIMSFHALVAVAYMIELMCRAPNLMLTTSDPDWGKDRFAGLVSDLGTGLATIRQLPLTIWGKEILWEFEDLLKLADQRAAFYGTC